MTLTKEVHQIKLTAIPKDAITPFIPLIELAAAAIIEIMNIFQTSQYNKRICNSLLDRARLAEIAIDQLLRRRNENEKKFKNQLWYNAFHRFVIILDKIKTFGEKISQLRGIKSFLKVNNISETFNNLMTEYDTVMKDLDFTMAIANEQQRQIDYENMEKDLSEINQFLQKIDDGIEKNDVKMSLIYEEVKSINTSERIEPIEVKIIDGNILTEPTVGRTGDVRGFRAPFIKKIYMNFIEVACKPVSIDKSNLGSYKRQLTILSKVSQSPNIIQFYGLSTIDNNTVMVLEWAELGNLRELYQNDNKIPLNMKLSYALDICRGIAYLNALDIYHHNLRCKNIMVTARNIAKLANFEFSRSTNDMTTSIKDLIENVRWLAPEKLKDPGHHYDHKCEIFSFGMLLWELIFEQHPYEAKLKVDKISVFVINGGREDIYFDLASPEIAIIQDGIENIIREAWSQNPESRTSISKLLIDLDTLVKISVKPNCPPDLQLQKAEDINIPLNLHSSKDLKIQEDKYIDINSIEIEPIIPIRDGIKAHKDKDYEKAWKCFERQAENQSSVGKYWKAYYLMEGFLDQKKDKVAALTLFKEAADEGIVNAQYHYACALLLDKNLTSKLGGNPRDAIKYIQLAAENGSSSAQFQMGEAYSRGKLGYERNLELAKLWYQRAALHNDKNASNAKYRLKELDGKYF
ncbi:kinase-like domain-containing protein [Glomus cerebriforme]|uniref:Kinase-like domain-containing protein n=1 Tax=Glomus cerebriforme TaxID=658196 RepID=A0A397ST95_9GLOM|nr:kinase-like domain-containing protein [Glomus cerebriforme]